MTKAFDGLQTFMKAQGIRNPKGLATYVATRYYGISSNPDDRSKEDKEEIDKIQFGITDKRDAKIWNPIMNRTGGKPTKEYLAGLSDAEKKKLKANTARDKEAKRGSYNEEYQKNRNTENRHNARKTAIMRAEKAAKKADEALDTATAMPKEEKSLDLAKGSNWSLPKSGEFEADPIAFASNVMRDKKGFDAADLHSGEEGAKRRNKLAQKIRRLVLNVSDSPDKKENDKDTEEEDLKKGDFKDLAGLVAALGGWAISDDLVRSGGGSPRGEMTAAQQREWTRLVNRAMTRKKTPTSKLEDLKGFWTDKASTYRKSKPIENSLLIKEHSPSPPRQGLVWDGVKHRWTNPKNIGRTVLEVQGKKRIRGSGIGAHAHAIKPGQVGGRGEGSAKEGRVARSEVDISTPIDTRSQSAAKSTAQADKLMSRLARGLRGIKASSKKREATRKKLSARAKKK